MIKFLIVILMKSKFKKEILKIRNQNIMTKKVLINRDKNKF